MKYVKHGAYDKVVIYGNDQHIKPLSSIVIKERLIYIMATLMLNRVKDFSLCKRIIVGSNHSKLSVLQHSDKLTENDIRIIQEGIDTDYFSPAVKTGKKHFLRQKYNIDKEMPILCYIGRMDVKKGVLVLLQAALSIKDSVPFKLILIGSFGLNFGSGEKIKVTEEELEIRKCIEDLGEQCITTGFVRNDQVIDYLADVDIGIVPSVCEDVSPLTYFEFQALGIPTIVSDGGGIPEYFSPDYSLMVHRGLNMVNDLATCLKELVNNKDLRKKMSSTTEKDLEYLGIQRFYNDFVNYLLED
jgi:spore coat protein SA